MNYDRNPAEFEPDSPNDDWHVKTEKVSEAEARMVDLALEELDLGDIGPDDDCEIATVTPAVSVTPDGVTPATVTPAAALDPADELAAAKAEHEANKEAIRRVNEQMRALQLEKKKLQLRGDMIRSHVQRLERAKAMKAAAASPMTFQDVLSLAKLTYSRPKADPKVKKANKKGRNDRHMAKIKADPDLFAEYKRKKNEAQNERRQRKKRPAPSYGEL